MDVNKIIQQVDKEFERAINQPEAFDFRERDPYKVVVDDPEVYDVETAVVDLENQNVKARYENQANRENHTCVKHDPITDTAIVESKANHTYEGRIVNSKGYYLVQGDEVMWHSNDGWEETLQTRPQQLANSFEDLYRQAMSIDNEQKESREPKGEKVETTPEPVPPPEEGSFTE